MSASVITVETHEDLSHKFIIQPPHFGSLYGAASGWLSADKSISHRALILGALAEGETEIQ
ncbi:hypothetical protein [Nostoc sp.]